jgi:Ser/Thr protein kinase RdoA (MazF antagonist)
VSIPACIKRYANPAARNRAYANYRWLAALGSPIRLPGLVPVDDQDCLAFEQVEGRHAMPADLRMLADHLGDVHGAAYVRDLHRARLGQPHHTQAGHVLPSFPDGRLKAVARELQAGTVLGARPPVACAQRLIAGADGPVAYYKDANLRNFLITAAGNPVTIDFDDLTLAPFGYDLAKLIVTLDMTHGPIPAQGIATALSAYNAATARHWPGLPGVTWDELMNWAEIHHILTSRYAADGRYSYRWDQVRPATHPTGDRTWP